MKNNLGRELKKFKQKLAIENFEKIYNVHNKKAFLWVLFVAFDDIDNLGDY